jgi:capsular polysaccharide biosynthesis protein
MPTHSGPEVLRTICPASVSKRTLPRNFDQKHLPLFQHELEKNLPRSELLRFHDVRVSAEGLIFKGLKMLPESFAFPVELDEWKRRSVFKFLVTNHLLRQQRKIDREVLWITDYWSKGYFHWLTDALTRLFVVRDRVDELTLLLPWEFATREFVKPSLEVFGVKHVDFIQAEEVVQCRSLVMPTHTAPSGHFKDEVIRGVRAKLLEAFGDADYRGAGERVYISRRAAGRRRIANEEEILPVLQKFGFQVMWAEELAFAEQVKLASRARFLVSNHGAGLTNMLFMLEGGSVLELRHEADWINNCYFILASALDFNYFYQLCEPQLAGGDPHTADLLVAPGQLEKNLADLTAG